MVFLTIMTCVHRLAVALQANKMVNYSYIGILMLVAVFVLKY